MKSILFPILLVLAVTTQTAPTPENLIEKIVNKAVANDKNLEDYGFVQTNNVKEFDSDGNVKKQESRVYRTVWIENHPYTELQTVNGKPPDKDQKDEEAKRRKKFIESLHEKKKKEGDDSFDLSWKDLSTKYDFSQTSSDGSFPYVLKFAPKKGKLQEHNRVERIFNHLAGTVWADDDYNLVKAQTTLQDNVKFGLGLFASIDQLAITYSQKPFESVWLPETFSMRLKARIALFKTANQQVTMTFSDYFHKS